MTAVQYFTRLQREDADGNLLGLILKRCAPPLVPTPSVWHRLAASSNFLFQRLMELEADDPVLGQWRALMTLWRVGKHREAADLLIPIMHQCR